MAEYKVSLGLEPTDKYKKARQDLIQAMKSINELSPQQQKNLAEEMFGRAKVAAVIDLFKRYWRQGDGRE